MPRVYTTAQRPLDERFWEKVNKMGPISAHRPELGRCWNWKAGTDRKGYGRIALGRAVESGARYAHHVSFFMAIGKWPEPCCLHRCDNPACVRPSHLFEGTHADNVADKCSKERQPRGEAHGLSRLKERDVRMIRASARTHTEMARKLGVCRQTIANIRNGRTWGHVV